MSQAEPSTGDSTAADGEDALAELRGVISFVCCGKEIAKLQLDRHKHENTRLKAYGDRSSQTLENTRKHLSEVFDPYFGHGQFLCRFTGARASIAVGCGC
jgi:hypothetical protein